MSEMIHFLLQLLQRTQRFVQQNVYLPSTLWFSYPQVWRNPGKSSCQNVGDSSGWRNRPYLPCSRERDISRTPWTLKHFLHIQHKHPLRLKAKLIRFWWSKVRLTLKKLQTDAKDSHKCRKGYKPKVKCQLWHHGIRHKQLTHNCNIYLTSTRVWSVRVLAATSATEASQ